MFQMAYRYSGQAPILAVVNEQDDENRFLRSIYVMRQDKGFRFIASGLLTAMQKKQILKLVGVS